MPGDNSLLASQRNYKELLLLDKEGHVVVQASNENLVIARAADYSANEEYVAAKANKSIYYSPVNSGQSIYIVDTWQRVVAHQNPSIVLKNTTFKVPGVDGFQKGLNGTMAALTIQKINLGTQVVVFIYANDPVEVGKKASRIVDQVLKGTKPADIPVETAEYFLYLNLNVAKQTGLTIPDAIVQQAHSLFGQS